MAQTQITKSFVDGVQPGNRDRFYYDSAVTGFGLKVTPRGKKVFIFEYRIGRRTRRQTLGKYGDWTVYSARKEAERLRGLVRSGGDPASEKRAARVGATMTEALAEFDSRHIKQHLKVTTARGYRQIISREVLPNLGRQKLTDIEQRDISKLHSTKHDNPYLANRILAVLSKFFNWCEAEGARPVGSNPCKRITRFKEEARERFMSPAEMMRFADALDAEQAAGSSPFAFAALRLLLLTGARRDEILTLRWEYVDLGGNRLWLPDSKTGKKAVFLPPAAVELLAHLPRVEGNPFVIVGSKAGGHLVGLRKIWTRARRRAGLDDVRIHDLRHSFASAAVANGMSLPMLGKLMGHKSVQTTARYAHLADDPLRLASSQVGGVIADAMQGGGSPPMGSGGTDAV
jgi:integrase